MMLKIPPEIKKSTKITGIFGDPVAQSLSPKMHNHAFEKLGLDYVYIPFLVKPADLKSAVEDIRRLNVVGVNVTIPHKEAILPYMDELSPEAKKIGAVNCVINNHGKLTGDNTDGKGFIASLIEDGLFNPWGKSAVIWGAGGAARAVAFSLFDEGLDSLTIVNRSEERAQNLAEALPSPSVRAMGTDDKNLAGILKDCNIFINASPEGTKNTGFLSPSVFVYDAVYAKETPLLKAAKAAKSPHLGGLGMLIRQGALSFSLWTGKEPPVNLMKEALNA